MPNEKVVSRRVICVSVVALHFRILWCLLNFEAGSFPESVKAVDLDTEEFSDTKLRLDAFGHSGEVSDHSEPEVVPHLIHNDRVREFQG